MTARGRLPSLEGRPPSLRALTSAARSANLVVCVLDAARADRLGCAGYPRDTTPSLDRLAAQSVLFRSHFAPSASTKTSTASLFTGLYPDTHRVLTRGGLDRRAFTLARALRERGWRTVLFSSNVNATPQGGLDAGFAEVFPGRTSLAGDTAASGNWERPEWLAQAFARWLGSEPKGRFFAYLHFLPPHLPYAAPEALTARFGGTPPLLPTRRGFEFPEVAPSQMGARHYTREQWTNLYDANLRWADWGVGEIVRLLRERGLLDNALLVVTSDHGEAFGEHGYLYHMYGVYDELVHIPLLVRLPGRRRITGEVAALTQTVDLLPTICDLYRIPYSHGAIQGRSLLPVLAEASHTPHEYVFAVSEGNWPSYLVRDSQWSLITYWGATRKALYDLRRDPGQTRNVITRQAGTAAKMTAALRAFSGSQAAPLSDFLSPRAGAPPAPAAPGNRLSAQTRRQLKALGYLH